MSIFRRSSRVSAEAGLGAPKEPESLAPKRTLSRLCGALRLYFESDSEDRDPAVLKSIEAVRLSLNGSSEDVERALASFAGELEARVGRAVSSGRVRNAANEPLADILGILPIAQNVFRTVPAKTEEATAELITRFEAVESQSALAAAAARKILDRLEGGSAGNDSVRTVADTTRKAIERERAAVDLIVSANKANAGKLGEMGRELESGIVIVNEINEINERSRIIAFNMAVEAARLGEGGRGIRVIVNELRSLNDRTTKFANEIIGLLKRFHASNGALVEEIVASSGRLNDEVVAGMKSTESSVESLIGSASAMEDLSGQIAATSVEVQKNLDKVLEALQFQDISRQIVEGGLSILQRVHSLAADAEALSGGPGDGQAAGERLEAYKREFSAQAKTKDEKQAITEART